MRELLFYPAFKRSDNGEYIPLVYNYKGKPSQIFWKSQSFIDIDYFIEKFPMVKRENLINSDFKDLVFTLDDDRKDGPSYVYEITEKDLIQESKDMGIVSGYCPKEEVKLYYEVDNPQEYLYWEMSKPIRADFIAELSEEERSKYMKFYTVDMYSSSYVCNILYETLDRLDIPWDIDGESCILINYSF
jgi:hypothetical protein